MPTFHFALRHDGRRVADLEGTELPDKTAAHEYACEVARELMAHSECRRRHWRIEVYDEAEALISDVLFATVDPTLEGLEWRLRDQIVLLAENMAVAKTLAFQSRLIVLHSQAFAARAARKPFLAAKEGHQI
jgi:hypothetical protein